MHLHLHTVNRLRNASFASKHFTLKIGQMGTLAMDRVDQISNVISQSCVNGSLNFLPFNFLELKKQSLPGRPQAIKGQILLSRTSRDLSQKLPKMKTIIKKQQHQMVPFVSSTRHSSGSSEPGPDLEKVAYQLTHDIDNFFMQGQDWDLYHKELVFQDNIKGEYGDIY